MNRNDLENWNKGSADAEKELPLTAAAASLVHFTRGDAPARDFADDDGVTQAEIARTVYLCLYGTAC